VVVKEIWDQKSFKEAAVDHDELGELSLVVVRIPGWCRKLQKKHRCWKHRLVEDFGTLVGNTNPIMSSTKALRVRIEENLSVE
jgi:hypothetical protein